MHHRSLTCLSTRGVWVCMALALVLHLALSSPTQRSRPLLSHHLTKRAFADQQCKGVYDKSIYARLDRICEDCYNLFREPQIHTYCNGGGNSNQAFSRFVTKYGDQTVLGADSLNYPVYADSRDNIRKTQDIILLTVYLPMQAHFVTNNCFTTDYFKACLDSLQLQDEMEQIQTWIKQLHGAEPGV